MGWAVCNNLVSIFLDCYNFKMQRCSKINLEITSVDLCPTSEARFLKNITYFPRNEVIKIINFCAKFIDLFSWLQFDHRKKRRRRKFEKRVKNCKIAEGKQKFLLHEKTENVQTISPHFGQSGGKSFPPTLVCGGGNLPPTLTISPQKVGCNKHP